MEFVVSMHENAQLPFCRGSEIAVCGCCLTPDCRLGGNPVRAELSKWCHAAAAQDSGLIGPSMSSLSLEQCLHVLSRELPILALGPTKIKGFFHG